MRLSKKATCTHGHACAIRTDLGHSALPWRSAPFDACITRPVQAHVLVGDRVFARLNVREHRRVGQRAMESPLYLLGDVVAVLDRPPTSHTQMQRGEAPRRPP